MQRIDQHFTWIFIFYRIPTKIVDVLRIQYYNYIESLHGAFVEQCEVCSESAIQSSIRVWSKIACSLLKGYSKSA